MTNNPFVHTLFTVLSSYGVNKMANIRKLPSGSWNAQIRVKGWPDVSKTFRIKRDAEQWARTTEDEITRGIHVNRSNAEKLTIEKALLRYTKEVTTTKKPSTQKRELVIADQLKGALGKYTMTSLNSEIIASYRDNRIELGKSANTVRLELALLSHLFTTAIKEWRIGMPANAVLYVRKPSPGTGRNRRLVVDEEDRLLRACTAHPNPFLGWIVKLALYTAMRKGEILSLTLDQVNLEKRTIFLKDTKNNDVRTVPLMHDAYEVVLAAINYPLREDDTDLLFYGDPGKEGIRNPYTTNRVWQNALIKAELEDFRFHDLRHEATSRFVEAGLSDEQVSAITGHKSMQMLKRYTHLRNEDLVSLLDSRFNTSPSKH